MATPFPHPEKLRLGSCAWSWEDWRGPFFPPHLGHGSWLEFYSRYFDAVEVDTTFYHTPAIHVVEHWFNQTPDRFRFAVKMPRQITHQNRLRESHAELERFLQAVSHLRHKLACVLIQLSPSFSPAQDELALRKFIHRLPKEVRFAIEFRHPDWHLPRILHLLEDHKVCWVWNDTTSLANQTKAAFGFHPHTADFLYMRLLGDLRTEFGSDGQRGHHYGQLLWSRADSLENWKFKLARHMDRSAEALVFVSNHFEGMAPLSCQRFAQLCGIQVKLPEPEPALQMSLL